METTLNPKTQDSTNDSPTIDRLDAINYESIYYKHVISLIPDCDISALDPKGRNWIENRLNANDGSDHARAHGMVDHGMIIEFNEVATNERLADDLQNEALILSIWDPKFLQKEPKLASFMNGVTVL